MKLKLPALYLALNLCFIPLALAQVPRFYEPLFVDANSTVLGSIVVADFNNDRIPDVATANQAYGSTVAIVLGLGHGTFAPGDTYFAGRGPQRFAVADLNGDGNLDLIIPDFGVNFVYWSTEISVLLGNGDGTFQPRVRYGAGPQPSSAAVGDFNSDGKLDVVVSCAGSGLLALFLGNGDGTLEPVGQIQVQHPANRVVVSDFNSDGKLDLAVSTSGKSVDILLGNGDGTFEPHPGAPLSDRTKDLLLADFNGDGKMDLAALGDFDLFVLLSNGDGNFQPAIETPNSDFATGFVAGDLDGDGRVDLVVADGTASAFLGNGDGTFQPVVRYSPGGEGVAVGEFNGQPGLDVLSAAGTAGGFYLLSNAGDGTLQGLQGISVGGLFTSALSKDLNGDGKPDLAVTTSTQATSFVLSVCLNDGTGQFGAPINYTTGADPQSLAAEDVDGDGVLDLVTANHDGNSISLFLGNGDGTFQARQDTFTGGTSPAGIAVADLNGDGLNDVVTSDNENNQGHPLANQLTILFNDGHGGFSRPTNIATGSFPWTVVADDLNRDGKSDLVVSYYEVNSNNCYQGVSVFLGNGDGTFQPRVDYPFESSFNNAVVDVADVNGDGIKDLVAGRDRSFVSVFLGNGDGTFQAHIDSPVIGGLHDMVLRDVDGDGKIDLVFTPFGGHVYLSAGNGDDYFQPEVSFSGRQCARPGHG